MDRKKEISREELFARVWEKPTTVVAKEIGISDVGLAKLCHRMKVPKPPRGYWARVRAGKILPKPPLQAYLEESPFGAAQKSKRKAYVMFSGLQEKLLRTAVQKLLDAGLDAAEFELKNGELRQISPDLASRVIVFIQSRYIDWLPSESSPQKIRGTQEAVGRLVQKLLPRARGHVVVLRVDSGSRHWANDEATLLLRITPGLIQQLARMHALVMDNQLEHVARDIGDFGHAWSGRYLSTPRGWSGFAEEICVSASEFWVTCRSTEESYRGKLETVRTSISRVVPTEILTPEFIELPPIVPERGIRFYSDRIRELVQARQMFRLVSDRAFELDRTELKNCFSVAERLWLGRQLSSPFAEALDQLEQLEGAVESWEYALEAESERLCGEILGLSPGDDVSFDQQGRPIRIRVRGASLAIMDDKVLFAVDGYRYRKDGLLGKRHESLYLHVENDSGSIDHIFR